MLPLLICNSLIGAILFNTYSLSFNLLTTYVPTLPSDTSFIEEEDLEDLNYTVRHHPFTAGALAGAAQSLLATPLDNVTKRVDPADVAARHRDGVFRVMAETVREAMPRTGGAWAKWKFLYHGYPYNLTKDALGFSLFFGLFETTRRVGKRFVLDLHERNAWPRRFTYPDDPTRSRPTLSLTLGNVAAVVTAGSLAGMSYQLVAYPIDRLPQAIESAGAGEAPTSLPQQLLYKPDWRATWSLLRTQGVAPLYRGIGAQLVRVAPPSAAGLLIFEIANQQFWDQEE
ncbi:hypothetical protein HDU96_004915 [Phlyctochytrium bullatum]|nr:hypothetical protein HDU96_004915 [Phlyctochytrium bullatum]